MNIKKVKSGNIDQAYENLIRNNTNNDYNRTLHNRKSPLYKNNLRNNFYSFNRSPPPSQMNKGNYNDQNNPWTRKMNKYDSEIINLEANININDYLKKNQNRKRAKERSPLINNYNQFPNNNNYYNYNSKKNIRNKVLKNFESDDYEDKNYYNQYSDDNFNENWKKKILQINEQNRNYQYYNKNYDINNSYKQKDTFNDDMNYNDILSQSVNINLEQPKRFYNYNKINKENKNINLSNDYNKQLSHDFTDDLSDTSYKNQTYQNYYYTNYNNFPHYNLNIDTSSSNLYDDSYELNKTQNYTQKLKNKFSDVSKFLSVSSQENTSFDLKDDESYNTVTFKRPKKNDEDHYQQNLTIKIKKKDEKPKKNKNANASARIPKPLKKEDNTSKVNINLNKINNSIKEKKISNFKIKRKEKINKFKSNLNTDLNYSNNSENYNNLSNTTMFYPSEKYNYLNLNNNDYLPNINNDINNNNYYQQNDFLSQSRQLLKGRSPENYSSYNRIFSNNIPSKNINQNVLSMNNNINNRFDNYQNKTQDDIFIKNPKLKEDKKIKEITVDLSPRKKIFNLSNNNGNLNNKINNITPNYNYNLNDINSDIYNDKFSFNNNINVKPKSKIESCIITFDKPKKNNNNNNYDRQYKLSSSFDGAKFNKIKYIKKKIPSNNNTNPNNNENYNFYETPGINNEANINNNNNNFIYNKNVSAKKIYQKPGIQKLSNSYGNNSPKDAEKNNEVQDYCAPSPDYGKREKNLNDNIYNHSPLLVSGNFQVMDNSKKEQISPYSQKYDEFSFKEKSSNNINDVNYSNSKPIKVKIINNTTSENNIDSINNNINQIKNKNVYMKKTKSNNNFNSSNIFNSQRVLTFSNIDEMIKEDNNKNDNIVIDDNKNDNIKNINRIHNNMKQNQVTPFEEISKNDKITKLTIKSFSAKKKEIKEKPKFLYCFFKKYYKMYMMQPKKELMYISKYIPKPDKRPILSICYISKTKYNYITKLPISSYEYYTKTKVPKSILLPKINIGYMSKILIKNKEYIENKLNNIGNDKIINDNFIKDNNITPINTNKNININIQNKPKKRIILIRKTKKINKGFYNKDNKNILRNNKPNIENNLNNNNIFNDNNNFDNNNIKIINDNNNNNLDINKYKNDNLNMPIKNEDIDNNIDINKNNNNNVIMPIKNEEIDNNDLEKILDYSDKENNKNINKNPIFDSVYFKKKKVNIIKKEELLPDNKRFDNENSFISDNENISFNLNINKEIGEDSKNISKNTSRLFLFHKSIDNSTIKSNNTSLNESLNQSSSYAYLIKAPALNYSVIHNNLNNSINNNNDTSLSMISNNTINIELDKNIINKKNDFKIRTIIRGVKKQSKYDFLKNYKQNKNLKISEILTNNLKSKKEIEREKKVNIIIKEDLENYISFYKKNNNKNNNNNNKKMKYNWSMIEQLIIKIKVDIVDIINGYLLACNDLSTKKYIIISNEYIKNIIHYYKYNYLTTKNFNNIHKKILQLFFSFRSIKIYDTFKFEIIGKLLNVLLSNKLFFINDFYIFRQADEQTKSNIKKILIYCDYGNNLFSQIHL